MKKIKMKFPDGSVREVDDADIATARSLGAVDFTETFSQKNGKKVSMQFSDGETKDIDSADVAIAESLGGIKKKSQLGGAGAQAILPTGTEDTGQSSSLLMSDTKIESIEDYNKQFENITGHHKFDLSAPAGKPGLLSLENFNRRKAESEKEKFTEYRAIEKDIDKVRESAYYGSSTLADELKTLSTKPYGSQAVKQIISDYSAGVSPEAYQEDVTKIDFNEVAKNIITQNRVNGVTALDNLDTRAKTDIENATASLEIKTDINEPVYGPGSVSSTYTATDKIPTIDFNNKESVSGVINFLNDKSYLSLVDKAGNPSKTYDIPKLLNDLNIVYKNLVSRSPIDPAIENISQNINSAVADHFMRSNKDVKAVINEGDEVPDYTSQINTQTEHFKAGLNYIKFLKPGIYKNVVRALTDKNEISARDYSDISLIGQDIVNENVFRKSASDANLIGAETSYDYATKEERKAVIAGEIGELAKAKGYKQLEFSQQLVNRLGRELGYSGDDSEIVQELALEEGIGGYDAIPKSGPGNAFLKGLRIPFTGIGTTLDTWLFESPAETYLRNQRLDVGTGQKVPNAKGEFTEELASDRNNIWYDVLEGAAQFIPQVFLTKGIGKGLLGAAELSLSSVPRAALTAAQSARLVNYGGTFISQYLQTAGDAYSTALQKTGDPALARMMGNFDAGTTALSELLLPDIKIAEKAFRGIKGSLINNITDVFKKGGGLSELRQKSRPFIEKFLTEAFDISRQEVTEEVLSNAANYLDEAIFSPRTVKDRDFTQETWDTIKGTAVSMLIPSLFGAGGAAMSKDFSIQGLNASALNFESSKNDLSDALGKGAITQDEYNNSIKLLQTHRNNLFSAPTQNGSGQELSKQQVFDFAFQETNLKVLKDELKNTDSDVQKELINQKIKAAEDIQRDILFKETPKVEKPSDTIEEPKSNISEGKSWNVGDVIPAHDNIPEKKIKSIVKELGDTMIKVEFEDGTQVGIPKEKDKFLNQISTEKEPGETNEAQSVGNSINDLINSYEEGDIKTLDDLVSSVEDYAKENNDENLLAAVDKFRREQEYDRSISGRGDYDQMEKEFIDTIKEQNKPTTDETTAAPIQFRTEEQANKILNDADQLTVSQRVLPRDIPDIVDPDKKKMSVKDLKNRAKTLENLIVNCLT